MPTKKKVLTPPQNIIEYFTRLHEEGKEVVLHWDGGGDSGWVYLTIDGKEYTDYETKEGTFERELIDYCYAELDYGSWAGEFSANGEAHYDPTEQAFVGTDYYSEDDTVNFPFEIKLSVPELLWFDNLDILIEDEGDVDVSLGVKNGFLTPEHERVAAELKDYMQDKIDTAIEDFSKEQEFRSIYEEFKIPRTEFTKQKDQLVFTIDALSMGTTTTSEKDIFLDLTEIAHVENEN